MTAAYPYTDRDLERVKPSEIRAGDLLAHAGPAGSHRYVGDLVIATHCTGHDSFWGCEKHRITYRQANYGYELTIGQPESIPVCRVRTDREPIL